MANAKNVFEEILNQSSVCKAGEIEKAASAQRDAKIGKAAPKAETVQKNDLFSLKDLEEKNRKPTTIIFSKENYLHLTRLALEDDCNMSEYLNRILEKSKARAES